MLSAYIGDLPEKACTTLEIEEIKRRSGKGACPSSSVSFFLYPPNTRTCIRKTLCGQ